MTFAARIFSQVTLPVSPTTSRPFRAIWPSKVPSTRTPPEPAMLPCQIRPTPRTEVMRSTVCTVGDGVVWLLRLNINPSRYRDLQVNEGNQEIQIQFYHLLQFSFYGRKAGGDARKRHCLDFHGSGTFSSPTLGPEIISSSATGEPAAIHKPVPELHRSTPFNAPFIPSARVSLAGPAVSRP